LWYKRLLKVFRWLLVQAFNGLQKTAATVLQSLFSSEANSGLHATEQQLQSWLGQSAAHSSGSNSSSSSVLHASSYNSSTDSGLHVLGGSEEHVDRGLLTLIADTGPGLEVGGLVAAFGMCSWAFLQRPDQ
jgi:hypothetical protein